MCTKTSISCSIDQHGRYGFQTGDRSSVHFMPSSTFLQKVPRAKIAMLVTAQILQVDIF